MGSHSHVGITSNEAADIEADSLIEVDLPPSGHKRRFHTASLPGVKRFIGRTVYEHFLNQTLLQFEACSVRTLRPIWRARGSRS